MNNHHFKTRLIGNQFIKLVSCTSTNDVAAQFISSGNASNGTVISTKEQTNGRGQRGNTWISVANQNLLFSIIIHPEQLLPQDQFRINWVISLAIQDYLIVKGLSKVFIKWPNDIYVKDKKICGILIENLIKGKLINTCVIGVGLNLNQILFELDTITSVSKELDQTLDLEAELEKLIMCVDERYEQYRSGNLVKLKQEYLANLMWKDENRVFQKGEIFFDGTIVNVDDYGRLIMKTKNGTEMFHFKEVKYII